MEASMEARHGNRHSQAGKFLAYSTCPGGASEPSQDAHAACQDVWDRVLGNAGKSPTSRLQASLTIPSILWELGIQEHPKWHHLDAAWALVGVQNESSGDTEVSLSQFKDVVTLLHKDLMEQRARCCMYHTWAIRILGALLALGVLAMVVRGWAAKLLLLPAAILGPAAGILVVLAMDEATKHKDCWHAAPPQPTPLSAPHLAAAHSMQGTAQLQPGMSRTASTASVTSLHRQAQPACNDSTQPAQSIPSQLLTAKPSTASRSPLARTASMPMPSRLSRTAITPTQLVVASQIREMLSRPVRDLTVNDVAGLYSTLAGDELLTAMATELDLETNIAPVPGEEEGYLDSGAAHPLDRSLPTLDPGSPLRYCGSMSRDLHKLPRHTRKWSVEILSTSPGRSARSSATGSVPGLCPSMLTQQNSTPASTVTPFASPYGGTCAPWLAPKTHSTGSNPTTTMQPAASEPCPPWLAPKTHSTSSNPTSTTAPPTTEPCPPWLLPLPTSHNNAAGTMYPASQPATDMPSNGSSIIKAPDGAQHGATASGSGATQAVQGQADDAQVSLQHMRHVAVAGTSADRTSLDRRSSVESSARFSPMQALSRIGSALSLSSRHSVPSTVPAPNSHKLSRRAAKAAAKARLVAAEEAQRQLGWRAHGAIGDLGSGRILNRPGVPDLYFLENLPPLEARTGEEHESSSEASLDQDLDFSRESLAELQAGLAAINQGTMMAAINQQQRVLPPQLTAAAGSHGTAHATAGGLGMGVTGSASHCAPGMVGGAALQGHMQEGLPLSSTQKTRSVENLASKLSHKLGRLVGKLSKSQRPSVDARSSCSTDRSTPIGASRPTRSGGGGLSAVGVNSSGGGAGATGQGLHLSSTVGPVETQLQSLTGPVTQPDGATVGADDRASSSAVNRVHSVALPVVLLSNRISEPLPPTSGLGGHQDGASHTPATRSATERAMHKMKKVLGRLSGKLKQA